MKAKLTLWETLTTAPLKLGFPICRASTPLSPVFNIKINAMTSGTKWPLKMRGIQELRSNAVSLRPGIPATSPHLQAIRGPFLCGRGLKLSGAWGWDQAVPFAGCIHVWSCVSGRR